MESRYLIALVLAKHKLANEYIKLYKDYIEDIESDIVYLEESNYLRRINGSIIITDKGLSALIEKPDNRELILADLLMNEFPEGKKSNIWKWKGTKSAVAAKLRSFIKKYPQYSNEECVNATKDYVNSFYGKDIHKSMNLLIYFIEKDNRSLLLEFLEDPSKNEIKSIGEML